METTQLTTIGNEERMTSLQIAEITGKPHADVMKAIRKMEPAWVKVSEGKFSLAYYKDQQGKSRPCYSLNKEECLYIATKFNDEARAKLVKRWKELELEHKAQLPTTYLEALKSLVASEEQKERLALENKKQQEQIAAISSENADLGNRITEMLPKVNYYDRILQSRETVTITQIAQDYGMSAKKMNSLLRSMKVQRKVGEQWILYGPYQPCGYVQSKSVQITRHDGRQDTIFNTEWTTKGRIFLYDFLKKHGIVPLIEQR